MPLSTHTAQYMRSMSGQYVQLRELGPFPLPGNGICLQKPASNGILFTV